MRIVAGTWRGRPLVTTKSASTRPTADRVRQALFDMLTHAPWSVPWPDCTVLDAFAGTGALGLEALSRGAPNAAFFETDPAARHCLHANIEALGASARSIVGVDSTRPSPPGPHGARSLVLLDPPYRQDLIARALPALRHSGWIAAGALIVAETARDEDPPVPPDTLLAERHHGAARLSVWRLGSL
ncbi:16S rRNA (guanine(966)-N(2))-methyltransferase RsmD [Lichenicoccus sp.]|uniref:16S rRNA (guanine(966)-N(2))-methyltransferase RsmD n=1 Tax=Lichenicoccus sp. TaxID=2781899 RepID=UPI003D13B6BB